MHFNASLICQKGTFHSSDCNEIQPLSVMYFYAVDFAIHLVTDCFSNRHDEYTFMFVLINKYYNYMYHRIYLKNLV